MKFVRYLHEGQTLTGLAIDGSIYPVQADLAEIIRGDKRIEPAQASAEGVKETEVRWLPCIPGGGKIICVGLNYKKHAEEAGLPVPATPILFNKFENALAAHGEEVTLGTAAAEYDYEAELGVVIGRRAKNVSKDEALGYVFGYCSINDLSARDLQNRTSQWMLGKIMDGFCPAGPYLVTADEVGDPNELQISLTRNGELKQNSNTRDMIFRVDEIIAYVSRYMTLEPGDILLTGTPEGVIAGYPPEERDWLKPGDRTAVTIEKLGTLETVFKGE